MVMIEDRPATACAAVTNKVPEGCWVYEEDWSEWPSQSYECHPSEWPYNLEAPKGTATFHDIIGWFLQRHPHIHPLDVSALLLGIERCASHKVLTAQVEMDPEYGDYQLRFTLYECPRQPGRLLAPMLEQVWTVDGLAPVRDALFHLVRLTAEGCAFPPSPDADERTSDDFAA